MTEGVYGSCGADLQVCAGPPGPARFRENLAASGCRLALVFTSFLLGLAPPAAWPQTAGLALVPGRLEIQVKPGVQKTASFQIESPPSGEPVRGRLLLSLTDWSLSEEGSLAFRDPGTDPMSATKWITFSPAAVTIQSGQRYLVRVTVDTPADTRPGVYRAGIFVQERPPATAAKKGEHNILFRFRYMEVMYVIVPPVAPNPKLVDVSLGPAGAHFEVVCKMKNEGTGFVRPMVSWVLRGSSQEVVKQEKRKESDILLPQATLVQRYPVEGLAPGKYELSLQVDFHDDKPVQAMTRSVEIAAEPPPEPPPTKKL